MSTKLSPPLKTHGGKHDLARRIVALMPRHLHYVEAFGGGLSVLLARDPDDSALWWGDEYARDRGVSEVVNDLNGRLMNFWRVLQDPARFEAFRRRAEVTPLSRVEWEAAHSHAHGGDAIADAVAFFIDCRQSLAGRMTGFTSLTRTRTRRKINGNASEWLGAVEGLAAVHARLRRVVIENMPAVKLIQREDRKEGAPDTLFYLDPPYPHETRTSKTVYGAFEMTEADHRDLLDLIRQVKGKVILSGYPSRLYDDALSDWSRHTFDLPNNAAGGKTKGRETEVLWCNF
jgi:DNA adenine methylase